MSLVVLCLGLQAEYKIGVFMTSVLNYLDESVMTVEINFLSETSQAINEKHKAFA